MARSFLNLITTDGRLCRLAELGFYADLPSFDKNSVVFRQDDKFKRFDLADGRITPTEPPSFEKTHTSPDGKHTVTLEFASQLTEGKGYVHLVLRNNENDTQTVLTRFMGCAESVGERPFSDDSESIVFFGYPENELG